MRQATHAHTTLAPIVRRSPPPVTAAGRRRAELREVLTGVAVALTAALAGFLIAGGGL